jgi:RHS repeat-associated protein
LTNPAFDASNNRMASGQNWTYDSAGNVTDDPEGRTFIYDAENKQIEVRDSQQNIIGQYRYDGDGKRVKKIVPGTGEVTVFVYDVASKLIGEYSTIVASVEDAKVAYLTADHLGSPRILTDQLGQVISRRDFHPFGEEIATPQRTQSVGYGDDTVRQKFTGYERDDETGLEFAQARMYASRQGRFSGCDPLLLTGKPINPKTWNRYVYVLNNPLKRVDPSGLTDEEANQQDKKRRVYVFVFLSKEEQTGTIDDARNTKNRRDSRTFTVIEPPDFEKLKAAAPKGTEVIIKGTEATLEDFQNALEDESAAGVIFIGHATGSTEMTDSGSVFSANGLRIGGLFGDDSVSFYDESTKTDVKAGMVAIFGCDTKSLGALFGGSNPVIGINSGSDGLSGTQAIAQAGYSAAANIVSGKGPDAVAIQANATFVKHSGEFTKTFGTGRNRVNVIKTPDSLFNGDHVTRIR